MKTHAMTARRLLWRCNDPEAVRKSEPIVHYMAERNCLWFRRRSGPLIVDTLESAHHVFVGKLGAPAVLVLGFQDQVAHAENAFQDALLIKDRQASGFPRFHDSQSRMNFVVDAARYWLRHDLA